MNRNAERFAAYVKTRKHQPPRVLYHYTSIDAARKIIENETVLFSSPLNFNDPLDTQWNMLWQLSTPEFNRALVKKMFAADFEIERVRPGTMRTWLEKERLRYAAMSPADQQTYLDAQVKSLDPGMTMAMGEAVSDQLRRLRIFSLASLPDSIQMWSYYAHKHTGVVLGFDTLLLENHWQFPVDRVIYAEKLPEVLDATIYTACLDAFAYDGEGPTVDHERAAYLWAFTKADGWRHEEEWRFVHIADRGDASLSVFNRFPVEALSGIALGCRGDKAAFDWLAGMFMRKNPRGSIWLTNTHRSEFALVATPIDKCP